MGERLKRLASRMSVKIIRNSLLISPTNSILGKDIGFFMRAKIQTIYVTISLRVVKMILFTIITGCLKDTENYENPIIGSKNHLGHS